MDGKGDYGTIPQSEKQERRESLPINNRKRFPEIKALVAEFFGTATLVQVGCGANCVAILLGKMSGMWQVAAIWTLGAILGIYISAAQSGGHLNPAVSLSFALVRPADFPIQSVLPYWIAQLLGAFVAGLINLLLFTTVIGTFEEGLDLEDGETLESASAFGNYWRCVIEMKDYTCIFS